MLRYLFLFMLTAGFLATHAQKTIGSEEAVEMALKNQRNLQPSVLAVRQQQELLQGTGSVEDPLLFIEASPYEPLIAGVQQTFDLPSVYRNRKQLQKERIRLAELQLLGSAYDLKRDVRLSYVQLQYFQARNRLLHYQDSIYQSIRNAAVRFFEAGQINKLELVQATSQADRVKNEYLRSAEDLRAEGAYFRFLISYPDSFTVMDFISHRVLEGHDTLADPVQQRILQQEIILAEKELNLQRAELLPRIQAGLSFPTTTDYERPIGYQVGVTIPLWGRQNRARTNAAKTAVEISKATRELELQRLNAGYRQALLQYERAYHNLLYFDRVAFAQARDIIDISQRLFQGGELNYIESLRNLDSAFEIYFDRLEAEKDYEESLIRVLYLKGTL